MALQEKGPPSVWISHWMEMSLAHDTGVPLNNWHAGAIRTVTRLTFIFRVTFSFSDARDCRSKIGNMELCSQPDLLSTAVSLLIMLLA
jgi:hypothetical protein